MPDLIKAREALESVTAPVETDKQPNADVVLSPDITIDSEQYEVVEVPT
jgi:hypothetical protein